MDAGLRQRLTGEVIELIERAGLPLADSERQQVTLVDFGLGDIRAEGCQYVNLFLTERMRISVLVMLPNQTLPQHCHPPYDDNPGKEENVRCLFGEFRAYLPGEDGVRRGFIPEGKSGCYTVRHETVLMPGDGLTIEPGAGHWFQAGREGCVVLSCYTQADDARNEFADPGVTNVAGAALTTRAQRPR